MPAPAALPAAATPRRRAGKHAAPAQGRDRRTGVRLLRWGFIGAVWLLLLLGAAVLWFARDLPRPGSALDAVRRPSLTLQDRSGRVVATYGDLVGEPLRLRDLPASLPAAVVAVEDRRFWRHPGIDPIGLLRAAWVDLRSGRIVQGGSTLTQQVAKTLFLGSARTAKRKVQELLLTLWLEHHFTKREILEIYLNRVYLGAGAWGVDAAARLYFGVSARHLTTAQAVVLAGLPRAPSRFNPRVNPAAAMARGKDVLAAMVDAKLMTAEQARSVAAHIRFPAAPAARGWFADWAAEQAQTVLAPGADAVLRTTLDSREQMVAQGRLAALLAGPGAAAGVGEGAVIVLDAGDGAVRAMVGGRTFGDGLFNRALEARRQPGSTFKPFVWLAALQAGLTPDDTVLDAPIRIGNWSPANIDHRFGGTITLEDALARSVNTAAVRLLLRAGGPRVVAATASRLGIAAKLPNDASLALGTGEVSLLELTAAYAPMVNGGWRVVPHGLEQTPHATERVVDPARAADMRRMLAAVVTRGSGQAAAVPGVPVVGKTGTTQDYRDAWFIGSARNRLIGIWLGNDDDAPTNGVTGSGLPARLFHDIVAAPP